MEKTVFFQQAGGGSYTWSANSGETQLQGRGWSGNLGLLEAVTGVQGSLLPLTSQGWTSKPVWGQHHQNQVWAVKVSLLLEAPQIPASVAILAVNAWKGAGKGHGSYWLQGCHREHRIPADATGGAFGEAPSSLATARLLCTDCNLARTNWAALCPH